MGSYVASAAATTAKTLLAVVAASNRSIKITELCVGMDGVTGTEKPVLIEIVSGDGTTAGTSTSVTPVLISGKGTIQSTAAKSYSAEPTVLTPVREWLVDPAKGLFIDRGDLGRELESLSAGLIGIRATLPAGAVAVNFRGYIEFEE